MKVGDFLSTSEIKQLRAINATDKQILALARQRRDEKNQTTTTQTNQTPTQKKHYDYIMEGEGVIPSVLRGAAKSGQRVVSAADFVAESVGLDLIDDNSVIGQKINELGQKLDDKKEQTVNNDLKLQIEELENKKGRNTLDNQELRNLKNRVKEKEELNSQSANAQGLSQNIKAGINQMIDVATNPSEWTMQGVSEFLLDPLNAVSFGAGGITSKVGRTLGEKIAAGASAGAVEGAVVNSSFEYAVARGENKSFEEAKKIATQSAAGGVAAGSFFGATGALAPTGTTANKLKKLEGKSTKDILDNDLLKVDGTTYDDIPTLKEKDIKDIKKRVFKVEEKYKKGDILEQEKEPNFTLVYDNLPAKLNELVETEIIPDEVAKQIEYKNKLLLLGHKDVIYADLKGWSQRVSQDIIDASYAKKMNDINIAEDLANKRVLEASQIQEELLQQNIPSSEIVKTVNQRLLPTKEELSISNTLNNGFPLENRVVGTRVRNLLENSIQLQNKTPDEFIQGLKRAGIVDEFAKVLTQSYINKDINIFDDFLSEKMATKITEDTKLLKTNLIETFIKKVEDEKSNKNNKQELEQTGQEGTSKESAETRKENQSSNEQTGNEQNQSSDETLHSNSGDDTNNTNTREGKDSTKTDEKDTTKDTKEQVVQEQSILDFLDEEAHERLQLPQDSRRNRIRKNGASYFVRKEIDRLVDLGFELKDDNRLVRDNSIYKIENIYDQDFIKYTKEKLQEKADKEAHKKRYQNYELTKDLENDISYEEAYRAHQGTSFSPEVRARQEKASYIESMTSDYENLLKLAKDEDKKAILNEEFAKYRAGYLKRYQTYLARRSRVVSTMIAGPANFPTRQMRKRNDSVDNALNDLVSYQEKRFTKIRKKLTDSEAIRSDDENAIIKLEKKLEGLQKNQELMKEANKIIRSKKDVEQRLLNLGFSEKNVKEIIEPDHVGRVGFPSYALSNNNQNMRTIKQRISKLKKEEQIQEAGGTKDIEYEGATIHENYEQKRLQILFDDIPDEKIRTELKKRGFRWSPKNKAWQRALNSNGMYHAKAVLDNHEFKLKEESLPDVEKNFDNSMKNFEEC